MRILVASMFLVVSCGGSHEPLEAADVVGAQTVGEESVTTQETAMTEEAFALVLAPFTLTSGDGVKVRVDQGGLLHTNVEGAPSVVFTDQGEVRIDGELAATISPEGVYRRAGVDEPVATIAADGSTTVMEHSLRFGPDGALIGAREGGLSFTLAPADTPAKRLAMVVLLMLAL